MKQLETRRPRRADDASVAGAAERTYHAGHQLVLDRLELLALEAREAAHRIARSGAAGLIAVLCALIAWLCLVQAATIALTNVVPQAWAFVILASTHLLGAAAAGRTAVRHARFEDPS